MFSCGFLCECAVYGLVGQAVALRPQAVLGLVVVSVLQPGMDISWIGIKPVSLHWQVDLPD